MSSEQPQRPTWPAYPSIITAPRKEVEYLTDYIHQLRSYMDYQDREIARLTARVQELEAENKRLRKLLSDAHDLAHGKRPPGFPVPTSAPTEWEDKRDFWRSVKEATNDHE